MNITRDVLLDLLPAYLAGECSADSRALVEEYITQDPDFARIVDQERSQTMLKTMPASLTPDAEKNALDRTRALLRRRSILMTLAIYFSLFPFTTAFNKHGIVWMIWRDFPAGALVSALVAVVCWIAFFVTRHRVKSSGL